MATRALKIGLWLLLLTACSRTQMMSREQYDSVRVGEYFGNVEKEAGPPDSTVNKSDGTTEYVYTERVSTDRKTLFLTRYVFHVKDERVTSKHVEYRQPAGFDLIYEQDPNYMSY